MNNYFDLTGKVAFITGGAGMLGKKHAEAIIEFGGTAVIADFNLSEAEKVSLQLNEKYGSGSSSAVFVDVNCKTAIEKAMLRFDKIDILINNAAKDPKVKNNDGLTPETRFETMTKEYWLDGINTILNGTFLCSQAASNIMLRNGGGVILNIASDLGVIAPDQRIYRKQGVPENQQNVKPITYSAAKWGVVGMTKYLATYFANKNIRVNCLSPSGVFNDHPEDFVKKLSNIIPMGRMAHIDEYKGAIVFLCSDASSYMTGENMVIDGGKTVW
jgi:NAD(P)-dependent dehydrogenase (short-subunit alcohol dehydrogenase family)